MTVGIAETKGRSASRLDRCEFADFSGWCSTASVHAKSIRVQPLWLLGNKLGDKQLESFTKWIHHKADRFNELQFVCELKLNG